MGRVSTRAHSLWALGFPGNVPGRHPGHGGPEQHSVVRLGAGGLDKRGPRAVRGFFFHSALSVVTLLPLETPSPAAPILLEGVQLGSGFSCVDLLSYCVLAKLPGEFRFSVRALFFPRSLSLQCTPCFCLDVLF